MIDFSNDRRRGAALVLICVLMMLVFIAVAFSVDVARVQLTQLELQSSADLSARAGAEALARGVADPNKPKEIDDAVRDEIEMIATLNRVGGVPVSIDKKNSIGFGRAVPGPGGAPEFQPTDKGQLESDSDSVRVTPSFNGFPFVFGGFVGTSDVNLAESGTAMVQERDIVVVLDRSTSMMTFDAGSCPVSAFNANLRQVQEDLYLEGDLLHPDTDDGWANSSWHTEFVESSSTLTLSRAQALKLAVLNFRQQINNSRGQEHLGLVTYSSSADSPSQAASAPGPVDIIGGLSPSVYNAIVDDGITDQTERFASTLEDDAYGYRNFDFNYLAMRWRPGTNIADGIEIGTQTLFGLGRRPFATPILIVMTDGRHNQSGTPEDSATAMMASHPNLRIYTVTFGSGADISRMQTVASIGRGEHYHASNVSELVDAFVELANTAGVTLIE